MRSLRCNSWKMGKMDKNVDFLAFDIPDWEKLVAIRFQQPHYFASTPIGITISMSCRKHLNKYINPQSWWPCIFFNSSVFTIFTNLSFI